MLRTKQTILYKENRKCGIVMWTCPQCGRTFKRTNQGHYCSNVPADVDSYIASIAEHARPTAQQLADMLRREVPGITESIKWSMPSFSEGKTSIQFAVNQYYKESTWKTIAMLKFCLLSIGVAIGMYVPDSARRIVLIVCIIIFIVTYIPLMKKLFDILRRK